MGGSNGGTKRAGLEHGSKVAGLAPGQVDQISLADRLQRRCIGALFDIPDENGLDFGTQSSEVRAPHLCPAAQDGLAIGGAGGRQDDDPRPASGDALEERPIQRVHPGQELAGTDQGYGSGHGMESSRLPRSRAERPTLRR